MIIKLIIITIAWQQVGSNGDSNQVIIETSLGDIRGDESFFHFKKIRSFLGVPFAIPPTDQNRFKKPIAVQKWSGVLNATSLPNACYQTKDDYNESFWGSEMWNANTAISEDCLYLNIWAPANAYNLTVMVWIYGGGFYSGSASLDIYDGRMLAATQNVIVVNINYRLGPFGFLYLDNEEVPGNMGLLDQQLALHWIHDNIVSFGGNPNKVCLFGSSVGASSINAHLISPGSHGLFQSVILQSGSLENKWALDSPFRAKQKSLQFLKLLGCDKNTMDVSINCLRSLPADRLTRMMWNVTTSYLEFPFVIVSNDRNFFAGIDAYIALREGDIKKVPSLIGINRDEGNYWNIYNLPTFYDKKEQPELTRLQFDELVDHVLAIQPEIIRHAAKYVYSFNNSEQSGSVFADQLSQMVGDYFVSCDALRLAKKLAVMNNATRFDDTLNTSNILTTAVRRNNNNRVFVYYFSQLSSANPWPKWAGVMHGYELEYIFGLPYKSSIYKRREKIFSRKIMEYWANFAKHGRPSLKNPKNNEYWPEFDRNNHYRWMNLRSGSHIRSMHPKKVKECHFWNNVKQAEYTAYYLEKCGKLGLMVVWLWWILSAGAVIESHQNDLDEITVEIETKLGTIRGQEINHGAKRVRSFLGVPFAEPPIKEHRFKKPTPKKPWNGTFNANVLSPACYQGRDTYDPNFWGSEMWNANTPISEDCLYMNIWTPANAYNLTVMVWLFGGGFYSGSPSLILYDGKELATRGNVIVVNINYRVGPFGYLYLDHDDVPGNMGMLDQQLALYWIRDHIFSFGGDPSRISLVGESAGAASIVAHLIAPASKGLFRNGILQSGSLDNKWSMDTPKRAKQKSMALAGLVGCNQSKTIEIIECLREKPAQILIDNIWSVGLNFLEFPFAIVSRDRNFFKHLDGFVALRDGTYSTNVNLMFGINHDEGNFWNIYNLGTYFDKKPTKPQLNRDEFHDCVEQAFAVQPELVRSAAKYIYSDPMCTDASERKEFYAEQVNQMVGDYFFTCDSVWFAHNYPKIAKNQSKVFVYYFDQPSSANPWPKWTGVMHGYEIEYVFGVPLYNRTAGYTKEEMDVSDKVIQFWTSFATTGVPVLKPNGKTKNIKWEQYDGVNNTKWLKIKAGSFNSIQELKKVECDLWRHAKDIEYASYQESLRQLPSLSNNLSILTSIIILLLILITV